MPAIEIEVERLEKARTLKLEIDGVPIVVVRTETGVTAFENICPHAGWRLDDELVDGNLECPGHGWQFKPDSGECIDVPAYCLRSVQVTPVGDSIRLELLPRPVQEEGQRRC